MLLDDNGEYMSVGIITDTSSRTVLFHSLDNPDSLPLSLYAEGGLVKICNPNKDCKTTTINPDELLLRLKALLDNINNTDAEDRRRLAMPLERYAQELQSIFEIVYNDAIEQLNKERLDKWATRLSPR